MKPLAALELIPRSLDDPQCRHLEGEAIADLARRGEVDQTPHPVGLLTAPHGGFILARFGATPVGCGGWYLVPRGGLAILTRIYTTPAARRQGVATSVLTAIEQASLAAGARYAWAETGTELPEAINLYRSHGYTMLPPPRDRPTRSRAFARRLP